MNSVPQDRRFAPPGAHVEDVRSEGTLELAGRGTRLLAVIIDMLIGMIAAWIASLATPWSPFAFAHGQSIAATMAMNSAIGFILFAVVQSHFLAKGGQTIGKLLLKLRIVRTGGEPASLGRLLGLRYGVGALVQTVPVLGQAYGIIDALLIFRDSRKCLHDTIADTVVVKA